MGFSGVKGRALPDGRANAPLDFVSELLRQHTRFMLAISLEGSSERQVSLFELNYSHGARSL